MRRWIPKVFVILIILVTGHQISFSQEFVIFFSGNYHNGIKIGDAVYSRYAKPNNYVTLSDNATIGSNLDDIYTFNLGIQKFFNKKFGLSLAVGYMNKTKIDIRTNYTFGWTFDTSDKESSSQVKKSWGNTGSLAAFSINLNFLYRLELGKKSLLNLSGGLTICSSKVRLYSNLGYGDTINETVIDEYWSFDGKNFQDTKKRVEYVDWYELEIKSEEDTTSVGANLGLDFEQQLFGKVYLFIGIQYFLLPEQTYSWQLVEKTEYQGQIGHFNRKPKDGAVSIQTFSYKVTLSHFSACIGFKYHF